MRVAFVVALQVHQAQGVGDGLLAVGVFGQAERHVLCHRKVREQGAFLKHHADPTLLRAFVHPRAVHRAVADANAAGIGLVETGDEAERGGFAAPAGSEEAQDLAGFQEQVNVGDRHGIPKGFGQSRQGQGVALRH